MDTPVKRLRCSDEELRPVSSTPYKRIRMGVNSIIKPDETYLQRHSERKIVKTPAIVQGKGQLKLSAYMNFGLFTVHVVRAKYLSSQCKSLCDAFVKIKLVPEDSKSNRSKTDIAFDSNNPEFDEKFSFELSEKDFDKRLLISVWHKDQLRKHNEFLGCMSFGLRHLIKKESHGWFYLLTEEIGQKKHLQVSGRPRSLALGIPSIPIINKDIRDTQRLTISVKTGKHGFGFSVVESCPVKVGRVDGVSPAQFAGLQTGDVIIHVNGLNVSRSTAVSVAKIMKRSPDLIILDIERKRSNPMDSTLMTSYDTTDDTENINPRNRAFVIEASQIASKIPLPLLCNAQSTILSAESRKRVAIQRLVDAEMDFVNFMHEGMQWFSRPLRHCVLTSQQHMVLFQNIEKLVTISEYHVKQMNVNMPSVDPQSDSEDEDDLPSDEAHFMSSIGMIYESKVHMLSQAYNMYSSGLRKSLQLLSSLGKSKDFNKFIKNTPSNYKIPSISGFLFKPIEHIQTILSDVRDIYSNTESLAEDFNSLLKVVQVLDDCINHITSIPTEKPSISKTETFRSSIKSIISWRSSVSSGSGSSDNGSTSSGKSGRSGILFPLLRMA